MQWSDVLPLLQKIGISPDTLLKKLVSIEEGSEFDVTIRRPLGDDTKGIEGFADGSGKLPSRVEVQLPALHVAPSTEAKLAKMVGFLCPGKACPRVLGWERERSA